MDTAPATLTDVLLFPAILFLFGVVVYGAGLANGLSARTAPPRYRWVGVGILAFAAMVGIHTVTPLFGSLSQFYRATIDSRKILFGHYVALIAPLVALALVPLGEAWFRRSQQDMR